MSHVYWQVNKINKRQVHGSATISRLLCSLKVLRRLTIQLTPKRCSDTHFAFQLLPNVILRTFFTPPKAYYNDCNWKIGCHITLQKWGPETQKGDKNEPRSAYELIITNTQETHNWINSHFCLHSQWFSSPSSGVLFHNVELAINILLVFGHLLRLSERTNQTSTILLDCFWITTHLWLKMLIY